MNIKDKLQELPKKPGCYLMKNAKGEIIYVGKAKNLSNRVKSYFIGVHNAKTTRLVMDIVDFEFIITSTEKEAFILEINLIKKNRPKYNISLMDDKLYPYIYISKEEHPRIFYTRDLQKKGKYFGPYPNVIACKQTVDMLNKIYPLRKCNKIPKKECLYYHINNCLAPCINKVDKNEYNLIIQKITYLLRGNVKDEIKELKEKMNIESERLNYEKALEYLNIIKSLEAIGEKQKMETSISDSDIFNYATKDEYINIQVFQIRDSKLIERKTETFTMINDIDELFINYIAQFYLIKNNPIPKEIILPNVDISLFDDEISQSIVIPKQGKKKELLDLVLENINKELENAILKASRSYEMKEGACNDLALLLGLNKVSRIEAFDNSNISGVSSVSAMVCFIDGEKSTKDYRKFHVKTVDGSNESKTFKEIIKRRYSRLLEEKDSTFPDLIIMDGGKIQVAACLHSLNELKLTIPVIGLIKDSNHRTDKILYNDVEYSIDKNSPLFKFLTNVQDEVHRYAISFHHNVHLKNTLSSKLEEIKGIGPVKRKSIMMICGDIDFKSKLLDLKLTKEQVEEILKIYNPN